MLNPNVSTSSLSDASQIRYQKAVREISKLIGMNNTIKKDADTYRAVCDNLQMQNRQLFEKLNTHGAQKHALEETIKKYELRISQLEAANQNLRMKQQSLFSASMMEKERAKYQEQASILNQKLTEQGNTIINLQENVAQLQKDNKNQKKTYEKMLEDLTKQIQQKSKPATNQCSKCSQNAEYRTILQNEIIEIKKGYIFANQLNCNPCNPGPFNQKDRLVRSLEEKVRIIQEKYKRKCIEVYRLESKLVKVEEELGKFKDKQGLLETTAIQK